MSTTPSPRAYRAAKRILPLAPGVTVGTIARIINEETRDQLPIDRAIYDATMRDCLMRELSPDVAHDVAMDAATVAVSDAVQKLEETLAKLGALRIENEHYRAAFQAIDSILKRIR